jgi:DNA-binding GntR family transcriptional regulator
MPVPDRTRPIARRSAREQVYRALRTWIATGVLEPGEVLKDADIAKHFGVSRTPAREALQMLEQQGAVTIMPGRRTCVSEIAPDDLMLVYAPLGALVALAAELAAPRVTKAQLERLRGINERLLTAVESDDPVAAREADTAFHDVLVQAAANPYLTASLEPLLLHVERLETAFFGRGERGRESYAQHLDIIDAVSRRDAAAAREATQRNFELYRSSRGS